MASKNLRDIFETIELTFSLTGFAVNIFLMCLIIFHTPKAMKPYQAILIQNCATDVIHTISVTVVRTQLDANNGREFYITRAPFFYDATTQTVIWAMLFYVFTVVLYYLGVPVQFVYRYLYITKLKKVSKLTHAFMLLIVLTCCSIMCYSYYMAFSDSDATASESTALLLADPYYNRDIGAMLSCKLDNPWMIAYFMSGVIFGGIGMVIIIGTNYAVWKYLNRVQNSISSSTLNAHSQIGKILVVQALVPVVFVYFPILFVMMVTFLNGKQSIFPKLFTPIVSMFPTVNAVLVMVFMKGYRAKIVNFVKLVVTDFATKVETTVFHTNGNGGNGMYGC